MSIVVELNSHIAWAIVTGGIAFGWGIQKVIARKNKFPNFHPCAAAGYVDAQRCADCARRAGPKNSMVSLGLPQPVFATPAGRPTPPGIPGHPVPGAAPVGPEQPHRDVSTETKTGLFLALIAFAIAIAAGIAFIYVYWTSAANRVLGGTMALSFGGMGAGLILWARWLMPSEEATEEREPLASTRNERAAVIVDYYRPDYPVERRGVLKWLIAVGVAVFGAMNISLLRSFFGKPPSDTITSTVWTRGEQLIASDGTAVTVNTLQPGSSVVVFPKGRPGSIEGETLLIRVQPQFLELPPDRVDWSPMGYVAYSRICTHAGCPVGEFQSQTDLLLCPCHQSTFDVLRAAHPTSGPAARPLPQLPLYVDANGNLRAGGPFSEPPGPGYWSMP